MGKKGNSLIFMMVSGVAKFDGDSFWLLRMERRDKKNMIIYGRPQIAFQYLCFRTWIDCDRVEISSVLLSWLACLKENLCISSSTHSTIFIESLVCADYGS